MAMLPGNTGRAGGETALRAGSRFTQATAVVSNCHD